jgi:hypothetical protein
MGGLMLNTKIGIEKRAVVQESAPGTDHTKDKSTRFPIPIAFTGNRFMLRSVFTAFMHHFITEFAERR